MGAPQKDKLLDHNYDEIQELDNPLPAWWVNLFHITTIFAVIYLIIFSFFLPSSGVRAERATQAVLHPELARKVSASGAAVAVEETVPAEPVFVNDEETLEAGKKIFATKCIACHGAYGEGLVGPNLTDKYWIHGKGAEKDIYTVVSEGVPDKGMLTWKTQMSDEDICSVTVYVKSLQGSNPAKPKAPQGELVG